MFTLLRLYRDRRALAAADADSLIAHYGAAAYGHARERAHRARQSIIVDANRPDGHWDRVRRIIGRKTDRQGLDTPTRYLDDYGRS